MERARGRNVSIDKHIKYFYNYAQLEIINHPTRRAMAQVVIIGAGLTGISAAYHLEQQGFFDYKLFEKEDSIGGLCRSVQQDGFTFDYTGHLLHISDPYFKSLIEQMVQFSSLHTVHRRSFIYSHNTYTPYPYQINLHGLPTHIIAECIAGFVKRTTKKNPKTFIEWVHANFGAGFAKHFFIPYQKKIFACDLKDLTASWTNRFVPSTSLEQILDGVIQSQTQPVGYNAQFFYPKTGGIISWVQKLADHLINPVYTNFAVKSIDIQRKTICFHNGHTESYEHLITTIPLDMFITMVQDTPVTLFNQARGHLLCNKVVNFNLGINRNISDKHWIYFPENKYPFYRLGFPHNFSQNVVPSGYGSLYGEFAHMNKSISWVNATLKRSIKNTKQILDINDNDIVTQKVIHIQHAYVTYNFWREKNLPKLLHALEKVGIHSIGRYGAWKYASMQEAVLDGKEAAYQLLTSRTPHFQTISIHSSLIKPHSKELAL
jgi:protoporphyrinogen oxidase